MNEIINFLQSYTSYFLIGLTAFSIILLVCCIVLFRKLAGLKKKKYAKLEDGCVGDIVECLRNQSDALSQLEAGLKELSNKNEILNNRLDSCIQNVGVIRFNAFEDIGGEQSFAMAMLNAKKDGVVISSIHGRQDTRLYAKGITKGECARTLSDEERRALQDALS